MLISSDAVIFGVRNDGGKGLAAGNAREEIMASVKRKRSLKFAFDVTPRSKKSEPSGVKLPIPRRTVEPEWRSEDRVFFWTFPNRRLRLRKAWAGEPLIDGTLAGTEWLVVGRAGGKEIVEFPEFWPTRELAASDEMILALLFETDEIRAGSRPDFIRIRCNAPLHAQHLREFNDAETEEGDSSMG
jgi:hypothetical protein